ncbi:hypothetical protein PIB30_081119 [Stylosanthes scabra]|uniref:Uncharacterized protein n=1 Tax=Stylosanthes scabra TaxID=79078 RepID=A0ABU6WRB2_9FABA|nr:hypothetical protein [Stylosanthes scabra]
MEAWHLMQPAATVVQIAVHSVKSHAVAEVTDTEYLRTSGGVLYRACPIVAKPPPFLKAVFPWDCEEVQTMKKHEKMACSVVGMAGRGDRGVLLTNDVGANVVERVDEAHVENHGCEKLIISSLLRAEGHGIATTMATHLKFLAMVLMQ